VNGFENELIAAFPWFRIEAQGNECLIASSHRIALSPILQFLDQRGISVYEAKEMRPSLEDVFVKVTGIEAGKLHIEKEGGKK
jgi:ABC-2 type transport system ATP-binding protein